MMNFKDLDFLVEKLRELDNGKNHILITGNIKQEILWNLDKELIIDFKS